MSQCDLLQDLWLCPCFALHLRTELNKSSERTVPQHKASKLSASTAGDQPGKDQELNHVNAHLLWITVGKATAEGAMFDTCAGRAMFAMRCNHYSSGCQTT
ncbi:hypothetical protein PROFUN_03463 [Planoprotostelium fungivorum]|uniref:Uncharacterized protein n=1 Tax=Planoprotostelium fungivorum TaxID=1890364 RepID=A0A2P6MN68_9EUKA|nr:hypothetical protein PROFUN_03463 [Planoprotostelium fungivorum]